MLGIIARLILAATSGAVTYLAIEPRGWWAAGIIGVALLVAALAPWRTTEPSLAWSALIAAVHLSLIHI